uniref:Tegument antigen (I(H)A) n=1 Tax=Schistosoma japonicum TaxID=6182 RepID=C1L468_SCHJA|nr:Tegument antigen (I(H)A) [Schistosoma japonicum]
MEKFIEIFLKLDRDKNGVIEKNELTQYCKKENMNMDMVDEWLRLFDIDSNDEISLREFCEVLGLNYEEMIIEKKDRENMAAGLAPKLDPDIKILNTSMTIQKQVEITKAFKELLNEKYAGDKSINLIANDIKKYLDKKYGGLWQVFIIDGSFWSNFSHEPFLAIQFMYDKYRCVFWRSPTD